MTPPRVLPAKQVVIGLIAASLIAAGLTLAIEHAAAKGTASLAVNAAATPSPSPAPGKVNGQGRNHELGLPGMGMPSAKGLLMIVARDSNQTPQQVITAIGNGKTLNEIAGSSAGQVRSDALAALTKVLDQAVSRGVITKDSEQHLIADARDAIDQLMAAKLANAGLGIGMGRPGHPGKSAPAASPSASPAA